MKKVIILLVLFNTVIFAQQKEPFIEVTRDAISVDGKKIVKTATVAKRDSLFIKTQPTLPLAVVTVTKQDSLFIIKGLYDVLENKRKITKSNKAQIQIDPNISFDVFFKIMATASAAGYTDISYTSKINGKNHTESINFPEAQPIPQSDKNHLNLAVLISKDYLEIWARGGSLPMIFYKECQDGKTIKLCVLHRESEEDPGKIEMSVYSISDSAYLDNNYEFITTLSAVKPDSTVATLSKNSSRRLACGQSSSGVEDICIKGKPAISLRPRSAYDELARLFVLIRNRFIDSPDADEIIIFEEDEVAISKVLQLHHEARIAGFSKVKLAKLKKEGSKSILRILQ
jgi:biopolymer transport protein ExbD